MPRQCLVSRRVWEAGQVIDPRKPNVKTAGHWKNESFLAIFHDFAIDTDTSSNPYSTYPVAVIELSDGTIQVVHAEHITFTTPTLLPE